MLCIFIDLKIKEAKKSKENTLKNFRFKDFSKQELEKFYHNHGFAFGFDQSEKR